FERFQSVLGTIMKGSLLHGSSDRPPVRLFLEQIPSTAVSPEGLRSKDHARKKTGPQVVLPLGLNEWQEKIGDPNGI
ncbi:MAG: hypothetical protein O6840_02980, partial [Nitrospirae bacterium]|nr:hypothetical protein [Nitrospirota bacterium]